MFRISNVHFIFKTVERPLPLGMPTYMASGGHHFGQSRYRFLILPRYDFDLHSIIRSRQVETKNILIIASQLIDILEHIHDCGYAHSDIKAENIMIGKCTYKKSKIDRETQRKSSNAISQKATDKRKPARKLRMTLAAQDHSDSRQSKRMAKSKSYAESSGSSNKSEDSDFSEDFEKLSDDEDDDEDDDEIDEDDDMDENDQNGDDTDDSGRFFNFQENTND